MTVSDELADVLRDPAVALEIIETLLANRVEIRDVTTVREGYSGARLAMVTLANLSERSPDPRPCVIKYCPPEVASRRPKDLGAKRQESERHRKALDDAPPEFREDHLVDTAFAPIRCTGGDFVLGLSMADGEPLAKVELSELAKVCGQVWGKILREWACTSDTFERKETTVAGLLESELGHNDAIRTWIYEWAEARGLLVPALLELPGEEKPLPNPWRILGGDVPADQKKIHYLVGRTHGDLHGDNVLVPMQDGRVFPDEFRLIDLATYDRQGPLSRDAAELLLSLCSREIGASSPSGRDTFLAYLESGRRDESLDDGMTPHVRRVIDVIREPTSEFARKKGFESEWHKQLRVSLLAQAMLHTAYAASTASAAQWCSRLAGRLARELAPVDPRAGTTLRFDAGESFDQAGSSVTGTVTPARSPTRTGSVFIDREGQRGRLRAALEDQLTSVIVVSGPPGIGKTALVREVLADLGLGDPDEETSPVRWHDATRYGEIGVQALIKDIEPPGWGQVPGPSAAARLELALDRLGQGGGMRPVIVLDSAENLLKEGHLLRDSQLDLALDAVQSRPRPVVKIVFVTQHAPTATTSVTWTKAALLLGLDGLEPPSLREYFARLDPGNRYGLADLPEDHLRSIHGCLAGNPRLAELLNACLSGDPPALLPREVAPWLTATTGEVHQSLVRLFVDHLPAEQQRAAEALAAFGIPVETDAVISVLEPYVGREWVEPALRALVVARLVLEREDGRRYLRKNEVDAIFGRLAAGERLAAAGESPTRLDLVLRADEALRAMQKSDEDVQGIADLDMHFARVDAWLRAEMYEDAHDQIDSMDHLVRLWGSGVELRSQREAVRGRLHDDPDGEMKNLAALGDIYSHSGDLPSARVAYEAALDRAKKDHNREAIRRIHVLMGSMFWEHNHLAKAVDHYRSALALAGEDEEDGRVRATALMGLADCGQQHGGWGGAIEDTWEAYRILRGIDSGLASEAALRLVRWYGELDRLPDARMMLAECADLVYTHPAPSVQGELDDATAELDLYQGLYEGALRKAQQAVETARTHRDPDNLRRSLTTLALAYVHVNDFPAARKAIEESARYRVAGRETVELALRGVIAHRRDLPAAARDLFKQLHDETSKRLGADENDLTAWDYKGIALCHSVLLGDAEPGEALAAFRRARPEGEADPTPGLDDRLRFLVETLADGDPRLEPVLTELARIRPGRAR
ncbi:tetratricopeptide repeat protein [Actinomadura fibrosa]|uniref:Tetratricopeptide repeat protein n=1 Tax=Actinomadura fibrosa TaxID=111802 RepID=A0ABW2XK53_9ACTN|nr:tetratricopeptide repeat protein [Actinomadura fibrosa]